MEIKITRKQKLFEARQPIAVDTWLIHGRIIENGYFKRFKFVLLLDLELDTYDFETGEVIPYNEALDQMIEAWTQNIDSFEDTTYFYEICNDSIQRYNHSIARQF